MNVFDSNILRATARAVAAESKKKCAGVASLADRDEINRRIIDEHHKKIEAGYTRLQLIYAIGLVRGVLKER